MLIDLLVLLFIQIQLLLRLIRDLNVNEKFCYLIQIQLLLRLIVLPKKVVYVDVPNSNTTLVKVNPM